nr:sulfotransferase family protein [Paracoccaceae bacterium]
LAHFTHAFLIRDPAKTLTSIHDKWPDFHEGEVGFPEQRALFDLLLALHGKPPPVIDSDDLLEQPHKVTQAFCDAVGIPFVAEALTWVPGGDPSAHSWWDGGSFHANLANSTGLTPQPRRYVALEDLPQRVKQVHRRMKPHYDRVHAHRIRI